MDEYRKAESLELIFSGHDFFERLEELIAGARGVIHLQTYIIEDDETGRAVAARLKQAAARGVKVFVLADAYGSKDLGKSFKKELRDAGINFRLFSPLFSTESIYLGRRLHHKIAVADGNAAIVGGINIANKYRGSEKEAAWLDYAVLVKGKICGYLHDLCTCIYEKRGTEREYRFSETPPPGDHWVRFRRNDWIKGKNEIHKSYREAITLAEDSVIIVASYFLPGYFFRQLLKKASRRGVQISLILAGKSDLPWLKHAEKYLYRFLLKFGVRIYEWPDSVLHGKAIVMDKKWITIGSYNLNHLSHYRSIELNADIKDKAVVKGFRDHLEKVVENECIEIRDGNQPGSRWDYLQNSVAYYYYRFIMKLFVPKRRAVVAAGKRAK